MNVYFWYNDMTKHPFQYNFPRFRLFWEYNHFLFLEKANLLILFLFQLYTLAVNTVSGLDVRGSVHHSIIHIKNPTRCNSVSKFYFRLIWSSTCFGRHTAHHQEPKTAIAAAGFAYVEGCWPCSCWTLTASSNYTSNNPPLMQNQRLLVQF